MELLVDSDRENYVRKKQCRENVWFAQRICCPLSPLTNDLSWSFLWSWFFHPLQKTKFRLWAYKVPQVCGLPNGQIQIKCEKENGKKKDLCQSSMSWICGNECHELYNSESSVHSWLHINPECANTLWFQWFHDIFFHEYDVWLCNMLGFVCIYVIQWAIILLCYQLRCNNHCNEMCWPKMVRLSYCGYQ